MRALDLTAKLAPDLDMDGAIALLRRVVGCDSVTGNEAGVAKVLANELRGLGAEDVSLRDFLPGRPNAWGRRQGSAGGPHILLVGHTDTKMIMKIYSKLQERTAHLSEAARKVRPAS